MCVLRHQIVASTVLRIYAPRLLAETHHWRRERADTERADTERRGRAPGAKRNLCSEAKEKRPVQKKTGRYGFAKSSRSDNEWRFGSLCEKRLAAD
jgi:hypothetical protein